MSNFPAGSKIIITNADRGETYKNGDIFTVNGSSNGVGVEVDVCGEERYIASYEFEAYTEPFKVGDAVITTAADEEWEYKSGVEGTVTHIDTDEPKICVSGLGYVHTWDLKLATAKAEPTPTSHIKVLATRHPREYEVGDILEVHAEQRHLPEEGEIRVTNKHGYTSAVFKGQWEYVAAPVKVEPERKFKVGDKVVVQANPGWAKEGQTGVIERVDLEDSGLPYDVKGDEEWNFWMREQDLELVKEFTFADIQKGDTIRAEYTEYGVKHIREGIAYSSYGNTFTYWGTAESGLIADTGWENTTYTLLERPEPPKPNPFAEAKVGSIATYGEEGIKYLKTGDDAWAPISRKGTLSDYRNSDESMTNCGDLIQVTHNA